MIYVSTSVMSHLPDKAFTLIPIMVFAEKGEFYSFRYMQQKTMQNCKTISGRYRDK